MYPCIQPVLFFLGIFLQLICLATASEGTLRESRHLQQSDFDRFFPEVDECLNDDGTYGPCDTSRFPTCGSNQQICYNRRPRQDKFYADTRLPYFFIDYQSVLCYPDTWGGCSSCHPGRLCLSETRCVLDEQNYQCEQWF